MGSRLRGNDTAPRAAGASREMHRVIPAKAGTHPQTISHPKRPHPNPLPARIVDDAGGRGRFYFKIRTFLFNKKINFFNNSPSTTRIVDDAGRERD